MSPLFELGLFAPASVDVFAGASLDDFAGASDVDFWGEWSDGLVSDLVSVFAAGFEASPSVGAAPRESVLYQPDPLKTTAGAVMSRRGRFPQLGHFSTGPSL